MVRYVGPVGVLAIAVFVAWFDATNPLSTIVLPGLRYVGLSSVLAQEIATVTVLVLGGLGWLAVEGFLHWRRRSSSASAPTPAGSPAGDGTRDRDG